MRDNASQDKTFPPNIPTEYLGLQFDVTASFTQLYIQDSGSRSLINLCVSSHPSLLVSFFFFLVRLLEGIICIYACTKDVIIFTEQLHYLL